MLHYPFQTEDVSKLIPKLCPTPMYPKLLFSQAIQIPGKQKPRETQTHNTFIVNEKSNVLSCGSKLTNGKPTSHSSTPSLPKTSKLQPTSPHHTKHQQKSCPPNPQTPSTPLFSKSTRPSSTSPSSLHQPPSPPPTRTGPSSLDPPPKRPPQPASYTPTQPTQPKPLACIQNSKNPAPQTRTPSAPPTTAKSA